MRRMLTPEQEEERPRETEDDFQERVTREEERDEKWEQPYGDQWDPASRVEDHIVRIMTQNISTFPKVGTLKQTILKRETINNQITGLSELNTNWTKISAQESIWERTQQWYHKPKIQVSWLCDPDWPSTHQQGGVSLTIQGHLSNYVQEKGRDDLGRWAWFTLEGRSEIKTVVIQIYRPCANEGDQGSVFNQHKTWAEEENPIHAFDKALLEEVDDFRAHGYQVIVMGDFNQPMGDTIEGLESEMARRGIIDHVRQRYGRERAPNTQIRGSKPIDAILASETLEMVRGGYSPGEPILSDHRSIWSEFTLDSMLGEDRGAFDKPLSRKLQIQNKVVTQRFNQALEDQIDAHDMVDKATALLESIGDTRRMTQEQIEIYEGLDRQRDRAVAYANTRCSKRPSDNIAFSPEYQQALGYATIWTDVVRRLKTRGYVHVRWLVRAKKRWGIKTHISIPRTVSAARDKLREARANLKEVQRKAPDLRQDFLDALIRKAEDDGDEKKLKDLQMIRARERMRNVHTRVKAAQGKLRGGGGVKFVERLNDDGTRTTIKDKDEMEAEIMKANAKKLHSADESPLRQGELGAIITDGDYQRWEEFLSGELELPDNMEEGTRRWLQEILNMPGEDKELDLMEEEYIKSWMKPREHTACAPGPMHYGTFKAMKWSPKAAKLHTIMAKIPIMTGYTPQRWYQCTDSMLPKKKDEWRPSKLRLTALLTPDFNHNNKILGRAAMRWAEQKGILAPEQYGSRKHLSAAKHALNKRLVLDILRLQRRSGVICANDAKACYDRILHFAAYISLRRAGLTKEATTSMLRPIKNLLHRIRTAYGDSAMTYGGYDWERDPSGICQGNGAGPAIWALVSSPLLKMLRDAGFGAKLHAAIGSTFAHLAGFAFVDDADTIQTAANHESVEQLMDKAQAQLTLWEQGIRATGGGIEGSKSDFAVVHFQWDKGIPRYAPPDEAHRLHVPAPNGGREYLEQLPATTARRTLGVWQAPDGNETEQTKRMKEKATKWAISMRKGFLSREDITFGVKTSLYPSITFGMMATALTKTQCEDVFKPVREHALTAMGYNRHIPAVVVHGPVKYGGMGIKDLYTIQGVEHIKILIDEVSGNSPTSGLLQILHHEHVLEIGREGFLYDMDYSQVGHLMTDSWIKHTLEFVWESKIRIRGQQENLHKWREQDTMIMDDFARIVGNRVTKEDMRAANRCRQYLQVVTKSDIANGNGTKILLPAWQVRKEWVSYSSRAYKWPQQERPEIQDIRVWQRLLHAAYGVDQRYPGWARTVGITTDTARDHITWWYDRRDEHMYQHIDGEWIRWTREIRRVRSAGFVLAQRNVGHPPSHAHPAVATQIRRSQTVYQEGYDRNYVYRKTDEEEERSDDEIEGDGQSRATLAECMLTIDDTLKWLFERGQYPTDNGTAIATRIREGTMEAVSDGGLKDGMGTAAGISKGMREGEGFRFQHRVPGQDNDQTSYRSELCGILGNVVLLTRIAAYHRITEGRVTLGCDNEAALWKAIGSPTVRTGEPSSDILRVIHYHMSQSGIKWVRKHVKGHQDREIQFKDLDHWAQTNVRADRLAEDMRNRWEQQPRPRPKPARMPGEGWRVTINGKTVIQDLEDTIYEHRHRNRCMDYWKRKGRINDNQGQHIDWSAYGDSAESMPRSKTQWTHKHFSGFEATNYMLHKFGERNDPICPQCDQIERHDHVLRCASAQATTTYQKAEENYEGWLERTTDTNVCQAIIETMRATREGRPVRVKELWPDEVREVVMKQHEIGDRAFAEGCLHKDWRGLQTMYLNRIKSRRSARRWIIQLIQKTWMVSWDMWDQRNAMVHNHKATRQEQISAQLHAEIREIHEFGRKHRFLPRVAKQFFRQPIEEILEMTDYQKRIWRRRGNKFLDNDRKRMRRNRTAAGMREWLIPGSSEGRRRTRNRTYNHGPLEPGAPGGEGTREPRITRTINRN